MQTLIEDSAKLEDTLSSDMRLYENDGIDFQKAKEQLKRKINSKEIETQDL